MKRKPKRQVSGEIPATRVRTLNRAAKATSQERNLSYGDPAINMACVGELQAIVAKYLRHKNVPGYQASLNEVCVKLGRACSGPNPGPDTFVDGAAYFAIAGERIYPDG